MQTRPISRKGYLPEKLILSTLIGSVLALPVNASARKEQIEFVEQQYQQLTQEQFSRNQVLYYMERGKLAFDGGDYRTAAQMFDNAIADIETVYSNNPEAEKARQLFNEEKVKPFKGETYERAMVYYYRGLLDLIAHDYENARASFERGLLQDSMGRNRDFVQDFAALEYLSGWAAKCAGFKEQSQSSFVRAKQLNPILTPPTANKKTLIIGESGIVPFKYYNTDLGGDLRYWPHPLDNILYSQMKYGRSSLSSAEELYYQANMRGARIADQIAYSKENIKQQAANFGEASQNVASASIAVAQITSLIPGLNIISLGLIGITSVGLATTAAVSEFSDAIGSGVDIRQWKSLPNRLYFATSSHPATKTTRYISFVNQYGEKVDSEIEVLASKGKCQLVRANQATLSADQFANWEVVQLKLSGRAYPIYGDEKYWQEVSYEK